MYIHGDFGVRELRGTPGSVLQAMHNASFPLGSIAFGTINLGDGSSGVESGAVYVPAQKIKWVPRSLPGKSPDLPTLLHGLLPYLSVTGGLLIPQASGGGLGGGLFTGGGDTSGSASGGGIFTSGGGTSGSAWGGGIFTGGGSTSGSGLGGGLFTGGGGTPGSGLGGAIFTGGSGMSGNAVGGGSVSPIDPVVVKVGNGKVQIRRGSFTQIFRMIQS